MTYAWNVAHDREDEFTVVMRYRDEMRDEAEADLAGSLRIAEREGAWPLRVSFRQFDADDFDALIGEHPDLFPDGVSVIGVCAGCGGWITPLELERHGRPSVRAQNRAERRRERRRRRR